MPQKHLGQDLKKAIIYMILSAWFFTILNTSIRYVDHLPTFELVFFRSLGSVILGLFLLIKSKTSIWGNNKNLLLWRAFFGVTSMVFFYKAIQMMPMGTAVSLRYLSPIFAAIFAIIFLKEKIKAVQWIFFVIAFMGVVLLKGFDSRISIIALLVILTTAILSGMVYIVIRKIGTSEHPIVIVNYFMMIGAIVGAVGCLFNWVTPIGIEWFILTGMGIFGFIAQFFMTKALQLAEANLISPFKYAEAVFTIMVGWLFFGEYQTLISIMAILMIMLALIANVWVKREKSI